MQLSTEETKIVFGEMWKNKRFRKEYTRVFFDKFAYATSDLQMELNGNERKDVLEDMQKGYEYLMSYEGKIYTHNIDALGTIINKHAGIAGIRKGEVVVDMSKPIDEQPWIAPKGKQIMINLDKWFRWYHENTPYIDPFLAESELHINLMRTHPLEDGNKRATRLIMLTNFLKQNLPPVIIPVEDTELYYEFIANKDYEGFASYLKKICSQEFNQAIAEYKRVTHMDLKDSPVDKILAKLRTVTIDDANSLEATKEQGLGRK